MLWLYGVLTSVNSILRNAIMHAEEPCAIWCVCLLQQVNLAPPPDAVSCLSLFEIIEILQLKANRVQNGLECSPIAGASSTVSAM